MLSKAHAQYFQDVCSRHGSPVVANILNGWSHDGEMHAQENTFSRCGRHILKHGIRSGKMCVSGSHLRKWAHQLNIAVSVVEEGWVTMLGGMLWRASLMGVVWLFQSISSVVARQGFKSANSRVVVWVHQNAGSRETGNVTDFRKQIHQLWLS